VVCASGSARYVQEEEHSGCIHVRACCNIAMLPLKGIHQAAAACSYVTPSATSTLCWTVLAGVKERQAAALPRTPETAPEASAAQIARWCAQISAQAAVAANVHRVAECILLKRE